jgi:hypothetical protein
MHRVRIFAMIFKVDVPPNLHHFIMGTFENEIFFTYDNVALVVECTVL